MSDGRAEIIHRCASVGVVVHLDQVVCRVDGEERSFTAIVELAHQNAATPDAAAARAALDYLRRKIDGYDVTFEVAEEIAAGRLEG